MITRYKVCLTGIAPLLMHSTRGANPLDPDAQAIKKLTSKRKKTEDDLFEIMRLEYKLNAYYSKELGFYIPAEVIEGCIREGAKANKNGKNVQMALRVVEEKVKLSHDGTDDIDELYKDDNFKDVRFCTVNNGKIIRTRPRFNRWGLVFTIEVNAEILSQEDLISAIDQAGTRAGIGDYRLRYGKFVATLEQIN
jgi:hypothetical protein